MSRLRLAYYRQQWVFRVTASIVIVLFSLNLMARTGGTTVSASVLISTASPESGPRASKPDTLFVLTHLISLQFSVRDIPYGVRRQELIKGLSWYSIGSGRKWPWERKWSVHGRTGSRFNYHFLIMPDQWPLSTIALLIVCYALVNNGTVEGSLSGHVIQQCMRLLMKLSSTLSTELFTVCEM